MDWVWISSHEWRFVVDHKEARIVMSSVNIEKNVLGFLGMSFIYMLKRIGPKTEPWGTPALMTLVLDRSLFTLTLKDMSIRKLLMILSIWSGNLYLSNLRRRPLCQTMSNALFRSRSSIHVNLFLLWTTLMSFRIVEWLFLKPNCWSIRMLLEYICILNSINITFSRIFPLILSKLTGL